MGANAEEPNPFGSFGNHHHIEDDEAHVLAGGMLTADNTVNVLDSPFASSNIHDDLQAEAANSSKTAGNNSRPGQHQNVLKSWATGSAGASASAAAKAAGPPAAAQPAGPGPAGDANNNNGAVVDILESPFVSACLSQDLKKFENEMAAAAVADELSNSAAALNIGSSSSSSGTGGKP